jgi:nucleoside-diphosphate-sugar epimerase
MTMNIDKAKQKLGYSPRVGNQEGFERYAAWYHADRQKTALSEELMVS